MRHLVQRTGPKLGSTLTGRSVLRILNLRLARCPARGLAIAGLVSALFAGAPSPARAEFDPGAFRQNLEEVLGSRDYQSQIEPFEEPELDVPSFDWTFGFGDLPIANLIMWVVIGIGAILLIYLIANEVANQRRNLRGRGTSGGDVEALDDGTMDPGSDPLAAAQVLARQGRFTEAIRLLLAAALEILRLRDGMALSVSLTSREILGRSPIAKRARGALSRLVLAVELSTFGGRAADRGGFDACLDDYRLLSGNRETEPPS